MDASPLPEPLVIGGTEIPRGARTTVRLPIAPLYTLAAMAAPVRGRTRRAGQLRGKGDAPW